MLESYPSLMVQQQVEAMQVFSGLETNNRYRILDPDGTEVLYASEQSGFLARQLLRTHRPLTITVVDPQGTVQMTAHRKFFWLMSHLAMDDPRGASMGRIDRRFKMAGRRYEISDGQGEVLELRGPLLRPHTFMLERDGVELGRITKRWSGMAREMFTAADTFQVAFEPQDGEGAAPLAPLSESMRWAMLAAAIVIDLDFFENRSRGGGGTGLRFGSR